MVVFMQYGVGGRDTYFSVTPHAGNHKMFLRQLHNIFDAFIVDSWVADMEFGDVGFGIMFFFIVRQVLVSEHFFQ